MKNAQFNSQDIRNACENKLKIPFKDGKELNGCFRLDGKKIARITVPKGRKTIPPKTYKAMALGLRLSVDQFDQLIECTLKKADYERILRND
ncbi:MAG: hypothetical protein HQK59_14080 [Deltaproteobacteria bacterium]|nr:hypothetical protein [Deltaproteobacteria bacterium]